MVEAKYDLNAKFGQPKAVYLNSAIILSLENTSGGLTMSPEAQYSDNRRIVFTIDNSRFHMEIAMERTEFVTLE
jgi:hypothetical protein